MFRKPKKKRNQESLRSRRSSTDDNEDVNNNDSSATPSRDPSHPDDDDDDGTTTTELIRQARKRMKGDISGPSYSSISTKTERSSIVPTVATESGDGQPRSHRDLATSERWGPSDTNDNKNTTAGPTLELPSASLKKRNPFAAGPLRAASHVRVTARFDYQPDICKDYKDTGFCGFGDTCIYLHDRGDTMSGWQLEAQWKQQQDEQKRQQEAELEQFLKGKSTGDSQGQQQSGLDEAVVDMDDGLPFACFLCRNHFRDPVVTAVCQHYFCQTCILVHMRESKSDQCPICRKDTNGVFHQPTKLLAKRKRILGRRNTVADDAELWKMLFDKLSSQEEEQPTG